MRTKAKGAPLARRSPEIDDDASQAVVTSGLTPSAAAAQGELFSSSPQKPEASAPEEFGRVISFKRKGARDPQPLSDAPPLDLLDWMAKGATVELAHERPSLTSSDPEPRQKGSQARPRSRPPKPAAVEPIVSHRLARERWRWRSALLASNLTPGVKVAGFAIAEFVNQKTGLAFPTYLTIAKRCAMTERGVRQAVKELIRAGFLTAKKTRFKGPNDLRLALPRDIQSGTAMPDCDGPQTGTVVPLNPAPSCRTNRHGDAAQSGTTVPVEPYTEPYTEHQTEPVRPSASQRYSYEAQADEVESYLKKHTNDEADRRLNAFIDGFEQ